MITFESMMDKVHRNLAMLRKTGDEALPQDRKLTLINESLALVLERGDTEQTALEAIGEGTVTFDSQSDAIAEFNRCFSLSEICREKSTQLLRYREALSGRKVQPSLCTSAPAATDLPGKIKVACRACGRPVFLDPVPPSGDGPVAEAMRDLLLKLTQYVVHETCVSEAHRKAKEPLKRRQ